MSVSSVGSSLPSFNLPASSSLAPANTSKSVEDKFLEYAHETPAQRLFDSVLGQLGLTKDQFSGLSPDEQQKVTQRVQQLIVQQAQNGGNKQSGLLTDKSV